jgi:hypothetical protein
MSGITNRGRIISLLAELLIVCVLGFSAGVGEGGEGLSAVTMSLQFDPEISSSCAVKGLVSPVVLGGDPSAAFAGITISDPDGVEMRLDVGSISSCWAGVVIIEAKIDPSNSGKHLRATLGFEPSIAESCLGSGLLEPRIVPADESATVDRIVEEDSLARFEFDVSALSRCWAGVATVKAEDPELPKVQPQRIDYCQGQSCEWVNCGKVTCDGVECTAIDSDGWEVSRRCVKSPYPGLRCWQLDCQGVCWYCCPCGGGRIISYPKSYRREGDSC